MKDHFDCIIVGARCAGAAAAIQLARAGRSVLLIDRAEKVGQKNISGGVLWGHELDELVPDWEQEAPLERYIDNKRLSFLTEDSAFSIDFKSTVWDDEPRNGYAVLRRHFDFWLAAQAEAAGALLITGLTVRELVIRDGCVIGVRGVDSDDVIHGDCVIIADGINSRLVMQAGLRGPLKRPPVGAARRAAAREAGEPLPPSLSDTLDPHWAAIGVKEVIRLPREVLEDRFNLHGDAGLANEMVFSFLPGDIKAGAALYTNTDTVSLNLVIHIASLRAAVDCGEAIPSHEIIEIVKQHSYLRDLLRGGEVVEYGSHLIPEGGLRMMPTVYGDGVLVAGDAAGFCFSNGMVVQGMNYALASGKLAAGTVLEALEAGDFSAATLADYKRRLDQSYIMQDLRRFRKVADVTWDDRIHHVYPGFIAGIFKEMFTERGEPKRKMRKILRQQMKEQKMGLLGTAWHAFRMQGKV